MKNTILIIDDDPKNTFALNAVLTSRGYQCRDVPGMPEAFSVLETIPEIGIILMDMMMPGMDGYEVIPVLRSMPAFARIPVIAVTAQAMPGDRERCLASGADAYLSKPIDIDKLQELLNQHLL